MHCYVVWLLSVVGDRDACAYDRLLVVTMYCFIRELLGRYVRKKVIA